jgi:hypothetical protein
MNWVPDACTLPTAEQPLRVAEFDQLFARTLRAVRRTGATTLELDLADEARPELDDLIARESSCCSFFTFTVTPGLPHEPPRPSAARPNGLLLEITVPPAQTAVLDALADRL